MKIAVLGPAGFGGSHVVLELLNRGHEVTGISRNPDKVGRHDRYTPEVLDITSASIAELIEAFKAVDVVINSFNPPYTPTVYKMFVETMRKIVIAVKHSNLQYFITIGGTASLYLSSDHSKGTHETAGDSRPFWVAYRRATADSEAATYHMEERIGLGSPPANGMRSYRTARQALLAGSPSDDDRRTIEDVEKALLTGDNFAPDIPVAARASFMFFEGNETFKWSFVSPPAKYIPGPRTGEYEKSVDVVPLAPKSQQTKGSDNEFDGRLLGISVADLAVAVVDEVENPQMTFKHWSPVADLPGEGERGVSYAQIS